ncbi:MAG TPA: amino acid ABC transporter permease [Streptomyces sp.]|nr:amino acid ABC transporter permease [Streptomyces sp.]
MSAGNRVLFDAPGPRAQRRIRVLTVLSLLGLLALAYVVVHQFAVNGQLAEDKWHPFTRWGFQSFLLDGLLMTLKAAGVAAVIALPFGALLALGRLSTYRSVRVAVGGFVEFFRSVPLLLIMYVFLLAVPKTGYTFPVFWQLVLPVVLCSSALLAEIFRAGILALDKGQFEAASAIGLRRWQSMRLVILPQAVRLMVPTLVSQMVSLLKETTLGYVVSYPELLNRAKSMGAYTHDFIQSYLVVTAIYIVLNAVLSQLAHWIERRQQRVPRAGGRGAGGGKHEPGADDRDPAGLDAVALKTA